MLLDWLQALSRIFYMALHVVNSGSFPRPLSEQQEKELLRAFHESGDLQARNQLVEHNLRLVAHIIKKYYSKSGEQDDLISIGTIGLMKAVSTFDHTKGTRLATYASRCVENEIRMHFRSSRKRAMDVSFSDPIDSDTEGHPLTLMDIIAQDDTIVEDLSLKIDTEKLYRFMEESLSPRERQILLWRYGLQGPEITQREIAKRLGISRSYVSRIEKKALTRLEERFRKAP